MHSHTIRLTLATATLAAMPTLSFADRAPAAMDSCLKAFMTQLSAQYPSAPKLREAHYYETGASESHAIELTAWNPKNNHPVARALCIYDRRNEVVSLRPEPLHGRSPL